MAKSAQTAAYSGQLTDAVIIIAVAVVAVAVFRKLKLSPVLGYLCAGALIGVHGLGFVEDSDGKKYLAEFGTVFLLFYIGLELTWERLASMRSHVFGFGMLQIFITSIVIGGISFLLGLHPTIDISAEASIVIGGGMALSSTAVILGLLAERGEQTTQVGRLSLATLIMQDLIVVPMLIMVPLLAEEGANIALAVGSASIKAAVVMVAIFFFGKLVLQRLLQFIASLKSQELFTATTLLIVLSAAWVTDKWELSMALGAFVAGLLVAETEYRMQVESDIKPFKGLLLGLFFISTGMAIDLELLIAKLPIVFLITIGLMLIKGLIVWSLSKLFKFSKGCSLHAGVMLSQGSEFAFILFILAGSKGILAEDVKNILLIVITLSMALTPLITILSKRASNRMAKKFYGITKTEVAVTNVRNEVSDLSGHIIILGFGRIGKTMCNLLNKEEINNYVIIDSDPKTVKDERRAGFPVFYGYAEKKEFLYATGADRAKLIVITINDRKKIDDCLEMLKSTFPNISVVVRAWDRSHAEYLYENGADVAVPEAFEASLVLGSSLLKVIGTPEHEVNRIIEEFRKQECPYLSFQNKKL